MVKVGIVGVGLIAETYIEFLTQGEVKNIELVALSSRNIDTLKRVNEQYQCKARLFTDYEEMLDSHLIDACIICTPHGVHPLMAKSAIQRGIHVLVEKPLGIDQDEMIDLIEVANSYRDIVCGVLFNRRLSKVYRYVKELMNQNTIGHMKRIHWQITNCYRSEAYYHSSPWRGSYALEGGGILMSQVSHQLDLFLYLGGMPKNVFAQCQIGAEREIEVENEAVILMNYLNGSSGQFIASAREYPGTNRLEISGSKGSIIVENDDKVSINRLGEDEEKIAKTTKELFPTLECDCEVVLFDHEENKTQHVATIQNFVNAILSKEKIACTFEEAMQSMVITQAAYLSNWKQEMIELPMNKEEFKIKLNENK